MSKPIVRNAHIVIGIWTLSRIVGWLLNAHIAATHYTMTFTTPTRDVGAAMMWLYDGVPDDIAAALASIALVWVIEIRKPAVSVCGLAALYLYSGGFNAWRILKYGWRIPLGTPDYIGILIKAIIPALACLIVGAWWMKRSAIAGVADT